MTTSTSQPVSEQAQPFSSRVRAFLKKPGQKRAREIAPLEASLQTRLAPVASVPSGFRQTLEANLRVAASNRRKQISYDYQQETRQILAHALIGGGILLVVVFVLILILEGKRAED